MPLSTGTSNKARQANVRTELAAGKKPDQAVAIAYAKQRENRSKQGDGVDIIPLLSELHKILCQIKDKRV